MAGVGPWSALASTQLRAGVLRCDTPARTWAGSTRQLWRSRLWPKKGGIPAGALPKRPTENQRRRKADTDTASSRLSRFQCVHRTPSGEWKAHVNVSYLGIFESEREAADAVKEERGYVTKRAKFYN